MTRKYETVSALKRGDKSNLGNYKQADNWYDWYIQNNIKKKIENYSHYPYLL